VNRPSPDDTGARRHGGDRVIATAECSAGEPVVRQCRGVLADYDGMNAPDIDAPARRPAQKFGRYDVLGSIGTGGMGEVFLAYDAQLHRRVAIKALVKTVASPQNERLLREAQTLAQLSHPNLVHLYEVGEYEGGVFLVMEYIEGPSLSAWLHEQRRPWRQILEAFIGAGTGLAAAHRAGIVHRDFKPANVIIGRDGAARGEGVSGQAGNDPEGRDL
jgi:serine/threonine protein kinase